MASNILRLAVGCVFILFGRRAYRNPTRLYPNSFYTNPKSSMLLTVTRGFALLLILIGCFSIVTVATERLTNGIIEAFIALGLSVIATWYLRSRIPAEQPVPKQVEGFLTTKGQRFVGISLTVAALTILLIFFILLHS